MQLTIEKREVQGVTVVDLNGRLVLGEECARLRETLQQLLAANQKKIVVNLAEVNRVDSSGIGILVEAVVLTAKEGGLLKLVNVPRVIHNILALHRLLPAFEVYENENEALASF